MNMRVKRAKEMYESPNFKINSKVNYFYDSDLHLYFKGELHVEESITCVYSRGLRDRN